MNDLTTDTQEMVNFAVNLPNPLVPLIFNGDRITFFNIFIKKKLTPLYMLVIAVKVVTILHTVIIILPY